MRVALVSPKGPLYRHRGGIFRRSLRYAPLTLTTLASLVPSELNPEFVLVDEGSAFRLWFVVSPSSTLVFLNTGERNADQTAGQLRALIGSIYPSRSASRSKALARPLQRVGMLCPVSSPQAS